MNHRIEKLIELKLLSYYILSSITLKVRSFYLPVCFYFYLDNHHELLVTRRCIDEMIFEGHQIDNEQKKTSHDNEADGF